MMKISHHFWEIFENKGENIMGKTKKNAMSIAAVLLGIAILVLDLVNPQAGRAVITVLLLATTVMAFVFAGKASTDSRYRPRFLLVGVCSLVAAISFGVTYVFPAHSDAAMFVNICANAATVTVLFLCNRADKKR